MTVPVKLVSPAKVFARSTGDAVWLGAKQERALAHLCGAGNIKVLLGPPSSGKTTILRQFERQAQDAIVLHIRGPQRSASSVLSALLSAADLGLWTLSEVEQRNLFAVFAQQRGMQGKRLVLCVDRISEFSGEAWSEIERLSLLRFAKRPLVKLVISATQRDGSRSPLDGVLQQSSTLPFEPVHFLRAPDGSDVDAYIAWRMTRFGIQDSYTEEACETIASFAGGRFSTINLICQVLLWNRASGQARVIDTDAVHLAASKLAALEKLRALPGGPRLAPVRADGSGASATAGGRLVVITGAKETRALPLKEWVVIGRGKNCDLQLNSQLVSSHHAAIIFTAEHGYVIADLDSTNGLLVNGKFIRCGTLRDGDLIDISDFCMRIELNESAIEGPDPEGSDVSDDGDTDIMPAPDVAPTRAHHSQRS